MDRHSPEFQLLGSEIQGPQRDGLVNSKTDQKGSSKNQGDGSISII